MTAPDVHVTLATVEATRLTYFLRRVAMVLALAALVTVSFVLVTGRFGGSASGSVAGNSSPGQPGEGLAVGDSEGDGESDEADGAGGDPQNSGTAGEGEADTDQSTNDDAGQGPGGSPTEDDPAGGDPTEDDPTEDDPTEDDPARGDAAGTDDAGSNDPGSAQAPTDGRLVDPTPVRVLDTRIGDAPRPPPETIHSITVPANRTAVALSVTIMNSAQSGSVFVRSRAGSVEAVAVGGPNRMVTNFVVVPVHGDELSIQSGAGGHLVVDLVGSFEPAPNGAAAGRFIPLGGAEVTYQVPANDGPNAVIDFSSTDFSAGGSTASAYLIMVTADVGDDGGTVRLGPAQDDHNQVLMWGPSNGNRQARALAIVEPGPDGNAALYYKGGTVLTVNVVGAFTDDGAAVAQTGLYRPDVSPLYSGPLSSDPTTINVDQPAGLALITVATRANPASRLMTLPAPVQAGTIGVATPQAVEADVALLGVFVT